MRGDGDRLIDLAARAGRLAEVRADAAADAAEGIGFAGDAIGVLEATGGDQRHIALGRCVHGAGALARAPALLLDGEGAGDGVGELAIDRLALADAEVEVVGVLHRADRHALAATDAGLAHVARLVAQLDAELAGRAGDLVHLGEGVDVHAALERRAREARRQAAHGAVLGRERLAEARHVAAERRLALDHVHVDAARRELLGGGHAGDAAADHERRAGEERTPARQVAHVLRPGDGPFEDLLGLHLGQFGLVLVDEAAALAQVGEGHRVLAQSQIARDALERRALEPRRATGDDQVVEPAVLDGLADEVVALGAAHELVDGDAAHAGDGAGVRRQVVEVEDAADVAAALAEEDSGAHVRRLPSSGRRCARAEARRPASASPVRSPCRGRRPAPGRAVVARAGARRGTPPGSSPR